MRETVTVVGGGLAGSEAAWQLAKRGLFVRLYEMRPDKKTPAHSTEKLAELVCSNSLGADVPSAPAGILKEELRVLGSLIMECAELARIPAGKALAVDREDFSRLVTERVCRCRNIELYREEVRSIPDGPVIIATGPLMEGELAEHLRQSIGVDYLHFFDAVSPVVTFESIDMNRAYYGNRREEGRDYINCPLDETGYVSFVKELVTAKRAVRHAFDVQGIGDETARTRYFEGCLPVEVLAARGMDTLRFGPMRPVGLPDPRTEREPWAVLQLRRDNKEGTLFNLVGFQTSLAWSEQERVFRMIPALAEAEFVRKGVMHRNTFVCAPKVLDRYMRPVSGSALLRPDLFFAGQITGVEGYMESTASGIVAALNLHAFVLGREMIVWPDATAIGSLLRYLREAEAKSFQPMNVNLGIFPKISAGKRAKGEKKPTKQERTRLYATRSQEAMRSFVRNMYDM